MIFRVFQHPTIFLLHTKQQHGSFLKSVKNGLSNNALRFSVKKMLLTTIHCLYYELFIRSLKKWFQSSNFQWLAVFHLRSSSEGEVLKTRSNIFLMQSSWHIKGWRARFLFHPPNRIGRQVVFRTTPI